MLFKNTNQPNFFFNIISKFLSYAFLVVAKKLKSRNIKVTVINKNYIIKNIESL